MVTDTALRILIALQFAGSRLRAERGQTLAEYSLIITVIAVGTVLLAMIVFRGTLIAAFSSASRCLDGSCG
jgi:Flp pilus assembly pilin Flp